MTAEQLTSSSPIEQTESELVQTKDAHSTDENDDSGVDEQDPTTSSSDEVESNEKNEAVVVEMNDEQTIECDDNDNDDDDNNNNDTIPIVDAIPDAPPSVKPTDIDTSDIDDAIRYKNLKIMYDGRDILDFCANTANNSWYIQYTYLPEKNIVMCLANRSQYHRLSVSWDTELETKMDTCRKCSFQYPVKTPDYQCISVKKTTTLDAIGLNNDNNGGINKNHHASSMFNGNQQKSLSMFNGATATAAANNNNTNMNNPNANFNNNNNINNGYQQSMYVNHNNNVSKQTNYGFQYNSNATNNSNGFMNNNFNPSIGNKQLYGMYRQNPNNSNNTNTSNNANANNYGKMPYKMYSHFY